jgi:hypothetical protein
VLERLHNQLVPGIVSNIITGRKPPVFDQQTEIRPTMMSPEVQKLLEHERLLHSTIVDEQEKAEVSQWKSFKCCL